MDFVSTKRTLFILITTFFVAISIPTSVYLFRTDYFDIRNEASEDTDISTDLAVTTDGGIILDENLMSQWNFNEEGEITLLDLTINGNDGTLNGFDETDSQDENEYSGWTESNAKYSGALMFDGDDDFISVADSTSLKPESITISVWFNTEEDGYLVSKFQDVDPKHGYGLKIDSDVISCWVGDEEWVSGDVEVTDGEWHNSVCTYDGTSVKIYVDGELDASELQDANMSYPAGLTIGAFDLGSSHHFEGVMDCIQIYDVALSAANISDKLDEENYEYMEVDVSSDTSTDTEEEEEEVTADIDGDGSIGVSDYYLFTSDFDKYASSGVATTRSDFDQDDDIDMDDYTLFFEEYNVD